MTDTTSTELLTYAQTARRLGIDVLTIRAWARHDRCPVVRDGRRVRIPAAWVDGLLAAGWQA